MPAIRSRDIHSETEDDLYLPSLEYNQGRKARKRHGKSTACLSLPATRRSSSTSFTLVPDSPLPDLESIAEKVVTPADASTEAIIISGIELRPSVAFDTFWRFAAERKAIDDKRRAGLPAPWTDDEILKNHFFCNTYRVLDKGCQFLIREVIEKGSQDPEEIVFRVILFNLFTKIETWELLDRELGPLTWKKYNRNAYSAVLDEAVDTGITLYTRAFIKPAPHFGNLKNHTNHLYFLECLMDNQLASRLLVAPYMADVYEYLISFPSMGPFSTYQLMLCLSYTKVLNFHENDFVISGPGSISGLDKIFGKTSMQKGRNAMPQFDVEVMQYMTGNQKYHFQRLGLDFSGLGPEQLPMSVADIEHTLCEVDKYCRVAHPSLKGKRVHLHRSFSHSEAKQYGPAIIPKAWSHPARITPCIRANKELVIEKRYVVSRISDHHDGPDGRQFLVFWEGYPASDASWEFEISLKEEAPAAIADYFATRKP